MHFKHTKQTHSSNRYRILQDSWFFCLKFCNDHRLPVLSSLIYLQISANIKLKICCGDVNLMSKGCKWDVCVCWWMKIIWIHQFYINSTSFLHHTHIWHHDVEFNTSILHDDVKCVCDVKLMNNVMWSNASFVHLNISFPHHIWPSTRKLWILYDLLPSVATVDFWEAIYPWTNGTTVNRLEFKNFLIPWVWRALILKPVKCTIFNVSSLCQTSSIAREFVFSDSTLFLSKFRSLPIDDWIESLYFAIRLE